MRIRPDRRAARRTRLAAAAHLRCRARGGGASALPVQFATPSPAEPVQAAVPDRPARRGAWVGRLHDRKTALRRHRNRGPRTAPVVRPVPARLRRRAGHPPPFAGARRDPGRRAGDRVGIGDRAPGVGLLRAADDRRACAAPGIAYGHRDPDGGDDPHGRPGARGATASEACRGSPYLGSPGRVRDRRARGAGVQCRGDPDPTGAAILRPRGGQRRQRATFLPTGRYCSAVSAPACSLTPGHCGASWWNLSSAA